jgi:hypothetical protein
MSHTIRPSCTFLTTAVLTWRRSWFAGYAFVAAIALFLFPARYLVPGGQAFAPSLVVLACVGLMGFLYLRKSQLAPAHDRQPG